MAVQYKGVDTVEITDVNADIFQSAWCKPLCTLAVLDGLLNGPKAQGVWGGGLQTYVCPQRPIVS